MELVTIEQRNFFMNLFSVAIADNNIDPSEIRFLYELGIERGLTKEQIDEIIANPHKARFIKPSTLIEIIEQLYDIVRMILQDGIIHPHEVEICKSFAKRFEVKEEIIDELIEKLIEEVRKGVTKEVLIEQVTKIL
jgi:uncharacterized tellurite resistance protein B-like protein